MLIQPVDEDTKATVRGILERFLPVDDHWSEGNFSELYSNACDRFELNCLPPAAFGSSLNENPHLTLRDKDHYFVLEPPDDAPLLPFVTLQSDDGWVHFRVYVLLVACYGDAQIQSVAFRYETDEGEDGSGKHDFCHAQLCHKISRHGKVVTPCWTLNSAPAIPVEAKNQVSLVLGMLTSIYGRQRVLGKFDHTDKRVWDEMKNIRALRPNQNKRNPASV